MDFEEAFLSHLKETVSVTVEADNLAIILDGAICRYVINSYWDEGIYKRYSTLHIFLQPNQMVKIANNEKAKRILEKYAKLTWSKKEAPLSFVEYAGNFPENIFDSYIADADNLTDTNQPIHSIFGEPSTDPQFQCDIFVIMPFSDEFETVYKDYITPCVNELGLTVKLGKDPFSGKDIIHDIWSLLNACRLVIADCTNRNPNVFYELGMAHTLDKRVIMLTRDAKDLPFDVAGKRAIEYQYDPAKLPKLKSELKKAIQKILGIPS